MRHASAAALAILLGACRHPTQVGTGEGAAPAASERPKEREAPSRAQKGVPPRGERPEIPSSPKALLAEGEIGRIQDALEQRGYLARHHRRGELDDATTAALRKLQRDSGLAETGFPDRETLRQLGIDPEKAYGKVREEGRKEAQKDEGK